MSTTKLDHIAIAVPRMAEATTYLDEELGGVPTFGSNGRLFNFGQWRFEGGGRLEILEPHGEDGFLHRFLAHHGPGIHHVTFMVASLREACDRARACGYSIVGYDDSRPRWKEAFLHPKEALGIVVQLAESAGPSSHERRWQPPRRLEDPPAPVRLLGLRLRVRSPERAHTQWEAVLHGERSESPAGDLIYRWPQSSLRLVVEIDPDRAEGPIQIELASDRAIANVGLPHPSLGAVFAQVPP